MPWTTPTLTDVRSNNAAYIAGKLKVPILPNGDVRVLADANAGNAHLALQYLDWLALQLLPDTAETQFLDKWANIWVTNADGSRGRKSASYASGSATVSGVSGVVVPAGALLNSGTVTYQSIQAVTLGSGPTTVMLRALDAGSAGNLATGSTLSIFSATAGVSSQAVVLAMTGGADQETDDELRVRVLDRIREPPMGGDADDYVSWALSVAGVTRAWCSPLEMGMGTVTVRFMCDDLRASNGGFPNPSDVAAVQAFLDTVRPVAVKDIFVVAPTPQPISLAIRNLDNDSTSLRTAIAASIRAMLVQRAAPAYALNGVGQSAQTIYAAWVSEAISGTAGVTSFDLIMSDAVMPNNGAIATLGSIGT